jgi:hypothetical protein
MRTATTWVWLILGGAGNVRVESSDAATATDAANTEATMA